MKVLITAGPIRAYWDKVRYISNPFSGQTGADIAEYFASKMRDVKHVTIVTSKPVTVADWMGDSVTIIHCETYDELWKTLKTEIQSGQYDVVIHSAAVNDYEVDSVFVRDDTGALIAVNTDGKMSSSHDEIFVKCVKTPKMIDKFRKWGFTGMIVKFKLEVGKTDEELIQIAQKSREQSDANFIVANCLEWAKERAIIVDDCSMEEIKRRDLPRQIFQKVREEM